MRHSDELRIENWRHCAFGAVAPVFLGWGLPAPAAPPGSATEIEGLVEKEEAAVCRRL